MEDLDSLAAHRRAIQATIPLLQAMRSIAEMAFRVSQRATIPLATYAAQVTTMLSTLTAALEPSTQREVLRSMLGSGPSAVLLIGSERGLCGAFNERLVREATSLLERDSLLICWGSRAAQVARSRGLSVDVMLPLPSLRIADYAEVERMTLALLDLVEQRSISGVQVVYDAPLHGLQHAISREQLLPPPVVAPRPRSGPVISVKPVEDTSGLLVQLITEQVLTELYRMVIQSSVSEQLARIAAMRLAGDNAQRLLDELTTHYNLARQQAITQSLLEIVTGYEATR